MSDDAIAAAQLVKAQRLIAIMDANARHVGMPPLAGQRGVLALEVFRLRDWGALARQHGIVPPSKEVVALILRLVDARAQPVVQHGQMPLRKTTPAPFAASKRESA